MNSLATFLATGGGVGYLLAPGTSATFLLGVPAVFLFSFLFPHYSHVSAQSLLFSIGLIMAIHSLAIGIIAYALPDIQASYAGADPQMIVLDEVVGFLWVFVGVPLTLESVVLGFCLFRMFDITKFWIIGWSECLPGAWGIVTDDALAGIAARVVLQLVLWAKNVYF